MMKNHTVTNKMFLGLSAFALGSAVIIKMTFSEFKQLANKEDRQTLPLFVALATVSATVMYKCLKICMNSGVQTMEMDLMDTWLDEDCLELVDADEPNNEADFK